MFPVFERAPVLASITDVTSVPLFIIILLKAELPLIVLFAVPLKVTEPEPAFNVPLLTQLPFTSRLIPALKARVPPLFMVRFKQVAGKGLSTVTVAPFTIVTSSPKVGTTPPTHVLPVFHNPPATVDVIDVAVL